MNLLIRLSRPVTVLADMTIWVMSLMLCLSMTATSQAPSIVALTPQTTTATSLTLPMVLQGSNLAFSELTMSQLDANGTPAGSLDLVPLVSNFTPSQVDITLTAFSLATVGNYTITLTGPGGVATTTLSVTLPPPTLTSFAPTAAMFGTTVVINGTNFGSQGNITAVQFGGVAALYYRVVSNTKIIAGVPSGAVAGDVTVVGNNGTIALGGFSMNVPPATAIPTLYWTNGTDNALASSNLTAKTSNTAFVAAAARYVHFSYEDNALFWSVADGATVRIRRAHADGSNVNNDFIVTSGDVQGVTSGEGYIFWVRSGGSIARANIDGTNIEENFITGIGTAGGIHYYNGDIYWSETGSGSSLKKVSVNGGTPSTLIANMQDDNVAHFAIDRTTGQIFWTGNSASGGVWRANSDGSGITKIYDQNNTLNGIALLGGYVYWINFFDQRIERVRYDGTGLETNFLAIGKNGGSLAANGLRFGSLPGISTFTPTTVAINGAGTAITITGTNFQYVTDVRFGNVAAQSFSVHSATEISAIVGTGASGRVEVATLTGVGGANGFVFSTVTTASVSPTSAAEGQNVTINGTNLDGVTEVRFFGPNGERAEIISKTPTQIVVEVPAGITESGGQIYLSGSTGFTSTPTFSLIELPVITSVTPTLVGIDDTVRISGRNLAGVTQVRFFGGDGTLVAGGSILSNTANEIVVLVPNRPAGAGNVWVGSPAGSATSPVQTTITLDPAITYVDPFYCVSNNADCLPNTNRVTIYGRNLAGVVRARRKDDAGAEQTILTKTNTRLVVELAAIEFNGTGGYFNGEDDENGSRLFLEHPFSDMTTVPFFQKSDSAAYANTLAATDTPPDIRPVQRNGLTLHLAAVDNVQLGAITTATTGARVNSMEINSLDTTENFTRSVSGRYRGFGGQIALDNDAYTSTSGSITLTMKASLYDMSRSTFAKTLTLPTATTERTINLSVLNRGFHQFSEGPGFISLLFDSDIGTNGGRRVLRLSVMEKKSPTDTIVGNQACATCGSAGGGGRAFSNIEIMFEASGGIIGITKVEGQGVSRHGATLVTKGSTVAVNGRNFGALLPRNGYNRQVLDGGYESASGGGCGCYTFKSRSSPSDEKFGLHAGDAIFHYFRNNTDNELHALTVGGVTSDTTMTVSIPAGVVRNRLPLSEWWFSRAQGDGNFPYASLRGNIPPSFLEVVDAPTITSVGGGNIGSDSKVYTATGATLQINGTNLDNITHVRFFGNDGATGTVISSTATQLIVRVPGNPSAAEGNIRITNIAGSVNSGQTIVVAQAPVITSVAGASLLGDGTYLAMTGATLTVHGNNFNSISEVKFFGRTGVNAAVTSKTNTQIVLTVPNNIAKFGGKIFMENIGGVAVSPEYFITFPPPTITAVSGFAVAESGNVLTAAGQTITVTGQNLDRDNTFRFFGASGTVAQVQSSSATQAVVIVPSGIIGTSGKIYVSNVAGTSQSPETVELMQPPALAGISPVQVWPANNHNLVTPGSTVTLTGTSLRFLTAVKMYGESGNNVTIQSSTATQVVITIPATASAASGQIYVQNIAGNASTPQTVEIVSPPTITSITPTQTWSNGRLLTTTGQTITLHGTNLQFLNNVRFFGNSGVGAVVISSSATQAVVRVPAGISTVSGQIYVENMAGNTLCPEIEIVAPPVISVVVGTQVWTNGNVLTSTGQSITIAGNNLQYINTHRLFGTTGTLISVNSSNANGITAIVPTGLTERLGNYHVSNIAGSTASVQIVEIIAPPVVTGLTVTQVWAANNRYLTTTGHTITVHGSDLQYINEHRFFGTTGSLVAVNSSSATQIELTVPAGLPEAIGNIFVKNIAGSTISSQVVEVVSPPEIHFASPDYIQRGSVLAVTGAHLQYITASKFFGTAGAVGQNISSTATTMAIRVPSVAFSDGYLWVENIAGSTSGTQLIRVVDPPYILEVTPRLTHTGATVALSGFNLNHLSEVRFWGSSGQRARIVSSSSTLTEVEVPAGVQSAIGRIFVKSISGEHTALHDIEIVAPPVIESLSTLLTTTGQTITLSGRNLQHTEEVRFFGAGGAVAAIVGTSTATQIHVQVPAEIAITSGNVFVKNIAGSSLSAEQVEIVAPAIIEEIAATNSPHGAPYNDGATVLTATGGTLTITGKNLLHVISARLMGSGGVEAHIIEQERTRLRLTVPAGISVPSGKLSLTNIAGERSSAQDIFVVQAPVVSSIAPFVTTTGLSISVAGTHLQYVNSLRFGGEEGVEAAIAGSTATVLQAIVPTGITARRVPLFVQNPAGRTTTVQEVEIISAPHIDNVSSLITGTGATFSLFGRELQHITSVRFFGASGVGAVVQSSSATQITVVVPVGIALATGQVYVENIAGSSLSPQTVEIAAPPVISGVAPLLAPLGATVTITGERLNYLSSVKFFGAEGVSAIVQSSSATQAIITVPVGITATSGHLYIENTAGFALSEQTIEVILPPVISGVSALRTTTGQSITIVGEHLNRLTAVRLFGASGVGAEVVSSSATQLTVVVPPGIATKSGRIFVQNVVGSATSPENIVIIYAPVATAITPAISTTGQSITIFGEHLDDITSAKLFGASGIEAMISSSSANSLALTIPPNVAGRVGHLYLENIAGNTVSTLPLEIVAPPVITSVSPLVANIGDTITIIGENISHLSVAKFFGSSGVIGTILPGSTLQQARLIVPAGIEENIGRVYVENMAGNTLSPQSVELIRTPSIVGVSTTVTTTGQTLTLSGSNLQFISQVRFWGSGGVHAAVQSSSATHLTLEVPAGIQGESGTIYIANSAGSAVSPAITIVRAPTVAGVSPNTSRRGYVIAIEGANLQHINSVRFFGANGGEAEVLSSSATQILVKVPSTISATSGNIYVQNIAGSDLSPQTVIQLPLPLLLYWSNGGNIAAGDINTPTNIQPAFVAGTGEISGIFIDVTNGFVYWSDALHNTIGRANLDGSNANSSFLTGLGSPRHLIVNSADGYLYWINGNTNTIGRASLSNPQGSVNTSFITGLGNPSAIAQAGATFYIADAQSNNIRSVGIAGGVAGVFLGAAFTGFSPQGVFVDGGYIYWITQNDGLRRRQIGGGTVENLVPSQQLGGNDIGGLTVFDGKIYWTAATPGVIRRANTDGSQVETIFTNAGGARYPHIARDMTASPPTITSFAQTAMWAGGTVTITGSGFKNQTHVLAVRLGGQEAQYQVVSDSEILATVGGGSSGIVQVQTLSGGATLGGFTFIGAPTITTISPSEGITGSVVTLSGNNLQYVSQVRFFGNTGTTAEIISQTSAELTVRVPGSADGSGNIFVSGSNGSGIANQQYRVISAPRITSISPQKGVTGGTVSLFGNELDKLSEVRFFGAEGVVAPIVSSAPNQAIVTIPTGISQEEGSIFAATAGGTTTASQSFRLVQPPVITALSTQQTVVGATVVLTGFFEDITAVKIFGGSGAQAVFTLINSTNLQITIPAVPVGISGSVRVENAAGIANSNTLEILAPPVVQAISPARVKEGDTIVLTGNHLQYVAQVRFFGSNGIHAPITFRSPTELRLVVPDGSAGASGNLWLSNPAGSITTSQEVDVIAPPVISSIATSFVNVGATLTLNGNHLNNLTDVRLFGDNGVSVAVVSSTATQVIVSVPLAVAGQSGQVFVANIAGSTLASQVVQVAEPLSISSVTPMLTTTGQSITLTGTALNTLSAVRFFGTNGIPGYIQSSNANSVTVLVPSGVSTRFGQMYAENQASGVLFSGVLEIVYPPTISGVSSILTSSGASLSVFGSELQHVESVKFFGETGSAAVITNKTATELTVIVPSGASSRRGQIFVSNIAGSSLSPQDVEIVNAPVISGVSSLLTSSGASLSLFGSELQHVESVKFFGETGSAAVITNKTATELTVIVPVGASSRRGRIRVSNIAGGTLSPQDVEIVNAPVISSVSPRNVQIGGVMLIEGENLQHITKVRLFESTGTEAEIVSQSNAMMSVKVPITPSAAAGYVYVENMVGAALSPDSVVIIPAPLYMYWSKQSTPASLGRIPMNNSAIIDSSFVSLQSAAGPMAIDIINGYIYWNNGGTAIGRVNLDGTAFAPQYISGISGATAIALDVQQGYLYWGSSTGEIRKVSASAPSNSTIVATGMGNIGSLSLSATHVYTANISNNTIRRVPKTGGSSSLVVATAAVGLGLQHIIIADSKLYWYSSSGIRSSNLTGGNIGTIAGAMHFAQTSVTGLTFHGGRLYWGESSDNRVRRVSVSGGSPEIFASQVPSPHHLSIGQNPSSVVPQVSSFSPIAQWQGGEVVINGSGFINQNNVFSVKFGGIEARSYTVVSDSIIRAIVADGSSGTVEVQTISGSAEQSGFTFIPAPHIASISASKTIVGATLTLTGTTLEYVTEVRFFGEEGIVALPTIVSHSSISVQVPVGISHSTGQIFVIGANGSALSPLVEIISPPIVSSVNTTLTQAGATITLQGQNLAHIEAVRFFGASGVPAQVQSSSASVLSVVVPDGLGADSGRIFIANMAGTALTSQIVEIAVAPLIASVSEQLRTTGETLTLTGLHLQYVASVKVFGENGIEAPFTIISPTELRVTVPYGVAQRQGAIWVSNFVGTALSPQIVRLVQTPTIASFSPSSGLPGSIVTISGNDFERVDQVRFFGIHGAIAAIVNKTRTTMQVSVPYGMNEMRGRIWLRNNVGATAAASDFSLIVAPTISDIQPRRVAEGGTLTIYGEELANVNIARFFGINGIPGAIIATSRDSLRLTLPRGITSDTGFVHIANLAGSAQAAHVLTIIRPPAIDSVIPMANIAGGSVTIWGQNFTDVSEVRFFGASGPAAQIVGRTASRLDVVIPTAPSSESGRIRVVNPAGYAETSSDFRIILVPSINDITPSLVATGGTITISGGRLSDVTEVRFFGGANGIAGDILSTAATQLTVKVPAGITVAQGRVWLRNIAGSAIAPTDIQLMPAPRILSVAPLSGVAGSIITILGEHFEHVESIRLFGEQGVQAEIIAQIPNLIRVRLPAEATAEEGFIAAVAPSGIGLSSQLFSVILPPAISTISPHRVAAGSILTIGGARLATVSEVRLFDSVGTNAAIISRSATSLLVMVPEGIIADSGKIWLRNAAGTARSQSDIVIIRPPLLSDVFPKVAPAGDTITISGSYLADIDTVRFFNLDGRAATIVSRANRQIKAVVPSSSSQTSGFIWAKNSAGIGLVPESFRIMQPPSIAAITPLRSVTGAVITLIGSHLREVTEVRFFGNEGVIATISRQTDDTLVVVAPPLPAGSLREGSIYLKNKAGTYAATSLFRYITPPKITAITPLTATSGATLTLEGEFDAIANVRFFVANGVNAPILSSSATLLQVQVPFGLAGSSGKVYVANAAGTAVSNDIFTVERPMAPAAPRDLAWQNITDFAMEATWQPSQTGSPAQFYDVEVFRVGIGGSDTVIVDGRTEPPTFRFSVNTIEQGASYQFRVRGENSVGLSPWSVSPTGTALDNRPSRPRFSSVRNITKNEATISWTNLNSGGAAALYRIELFLNGTPVDGSPALVQNAPAPADSIRLIELSDDTDYYYRLRAENQFGHSEWEQGELFTTERDMRRADSLALVALYNALGGTNWQRKENWLSQKPLDQWHGVTLANGRVTSIVLPANNLNGTIPATLGNRELHKLRRLILWGNNISGGVPASLGQWRELVTVELDHNKLSAVNADLSELTQLLALRLDENNLTAFPESVLQIPNSSLQILALDRNSLTALPARIDNFPQLRGLWLNNNQIAGSMGGNFITRMPLLESVFLHGNRLSDVPTLTTINPLRQVFIHDNSIASEALGRNAALIGRNEVNFVALPQNTLLRRRVTVYEGDNVPLEPNDPDGAFGYRWYRNDSLIAVIEPEEAGVHWILNVGGRNSLSQGEYRCEMYSPQYPDFRFTSDIVELYTIGIQQQREEHTPPVAGMVAELRVFPNPASDRITVEYTAETAEAVEVEIWNAAGKNVLRTTVFPAAPGVQTAVFNVSDLSSGRYIIHLRTATKVYSLSVVIIR